MWKIKTKEKWTKFIPVPVDVFPEELKKAVQKALLSQLTLPKSSNSRLRQCHRHVRTLRPSLVAPALGGGCEVQTWGRQTTEHVELPPTTEPMTHRMCLARDIVLGRRRVPVAGGGGALDKTSPQLFATMPNCHKSFSFLFAIINYITVSKP